MDLLYNILTAVVILYDYLDIIIYVSKIFFLAAFLSSFLILAILVSINTQYVHDTKMKLDKEREESILRTKQLMKLTKKSKKSTGSKKSVSPLKK
jgi:hypothetical protein